MSEKVKIPVCEENFIKVSIFPYFGNTELKLDSSYTLASGDKILFTDIKFFMSELKNDTDSLLSDIALFNYRISGNDFLKVKGNPQNFSSILGYLGVHNDNHKDPTMFPNDSPLNIMNCDGMHWGWNPGYSFIQIEAKADTISDGNLNFNHSIVYHVGTDQFLQSIQFSNLNWSVINDNLSTLNFKLDMKIFIENPSQLLNIRNENMTHSASGEEVLSLKVIQNFKASLSPF